MLINSEEVSRIIAEAKEKIRTGECVKVNKWLSVDPWYVLQGVSIEDHVRNILVHATRLACRG
jgi:hypothetical protein